MPTLAQVLQARQYPRMAELVEELSETLADSTPHAEVYVETKELLDEIKHLVVAAFKWKELPS